MIHEMYVMEITSLERSTSIATITNVYSVSESLNYLNGFNGLYLPSHYYSTKHRSRRTYISGQRDAI